MHRTHKLHSSQHQQINRRIQCTKHREFSSLLQSPSLVSIIQEEQPEHRKRLFTPSVTLATFISQALNADRSCQAAVNRLAIDRLSKQQTLNSVGTAAYCRARKRLPLTMVTQLARHLGDSLVAATPAAWRWLARRYQCPIRRRIRLLTHNLPVKKWGSVSRLRA